MAKKAKVQEKRCVACGHCEKLCSFGAIIVYKGKFAQVSHEKCKGCSKCEKSCPAGVIEMIEVNG